MGHPVDEDLIKIVSDQVANLEHELEVMRKSGIDEAQKIRDALHSVKLEIAKFYNRLTNLEKNMAHVELRQDALERKQGETDSKVRALVSSLEGNLNASSNDIAFLIPSRNDYFYGREDELSSIADNLKGRTSRFAHTAICGLGGVGKTSLALEFCWRHKSKYPGGIFWISGENNRVFQNSVREMALEIQITTFEDDFSLTLARALAWLKKQSQLWCLVVDNLDELEMSGDMRKLIRGKWKQGARGHLILTTRREPREIWKEAGIEESSCIELKCLGQEESVTFLRRQTGKIDGEDKDICELAIELGGLPLALNQAAAYIKYLSCSMREYVEQYKFHKIELLKKMEIQESDECTSRDRLAVHTTWLMNFEHITNSSRYPKDLRVAATLVMEISSFLGPDDIPLEVINEGLPQLDFPCLVNVLSSPFGRKEVMSLLTNLSLFQQFGSNSYCVHRLVQEVVRGWMDEKREDDAFSKEFFSKEFSYIAGTRLMHFAFVNTCSPVEACEGFAEDAAVYSVENPPSLYLWGKLASHATYLQEHLLSFATKNEESLSVLLYTEETLCLLNEVAISYSVAREQVKAQEIQKQKLEFLTHFEQPPSHETLKRILHFNMPLRDSYHKLISHCMKERPLSNRDDIVEAEDKASGLRQKGNEAVKCEEYEKALDLYSKGIELYTNDYRLFCNRALCYLKLNKPQNALSDCEQCLTLHPFYCKALHRKAWALDKLVKRGFDHLQGSAVATAALAHYFDSNAGNKEVIQKMFPGLLYDVIGNSTELDFVLRMPQANKTYLLLEGEYTVSFLTVENDLQVVGLGSGAVLNCRGGFAIGNSKCYLENVTLPGGSPPLVCHGQTALVQVNHCHISAGFAGCQDYPECNGGVGCVAEPPCKQTNESSGKPKSSGIAGWSGIQIHQGGKGYIDHCQIHHCGSEGAVVEGEGSYLVIRNCELYRNPKDGLQTRNGGQLVASENKVYDNGRCGFSIGPDAGRCLIRSNAIFENRKDGVHVVKSRLEVSVDSNDIHHNMAFGIFSDDSHVSATNNKIFENVFWGILCKLKSSANIMDNVIFSNKCGGICVDASFPGQISVKSNVVRDHAGPWLLNQELEKFFGAGSTSSVFNPLLYLLQGEPRYDSIPFTVEDNQEFNNIEGLFHPAESIAAVPSKCCCCSKELREASLRRCRDCFVAVYCGKECLEKHLPRHKSLCEVLFSRFSTTVNFPLLPPSMRKVNYVTLRPTYKGPRPKGNSRQAFIVKIQTMSLNSDPEQLLPVYDQSHTLDCLIQSSEVFHVVMECGSLGGAFKFTAKKAFFWAAFAAGGKKLNIFLNHLAPYQNW